MSVADRYSFRLASFQGIFRRFWRPGYNDGGSPLLPFCLSNCTHFLRALHALVGCAESEYAEMLYEAERGLPVYLLFFVSELSVRMSVTLSPSHHRG